MDIEVDMNKTLEKDKTLEEKVKEAKEALPKNATRNNKIAAVLKVFDDEFTKARQEREKGENKSELDVLEEVVSGFTKDSYLEDWRELCRDVLELIMNCINPEYLIISYIDKDNPAKELKELLLETSLGTNDLDDKKKEDRRGLIEKAFEEIDTCTKFAEALLEKVDIEETKKEVLDFLNKDLDCSELEYTLLITKRITVLIKLLDNLETDNNISKIEETQAIIRRAFIDLSGGVYFLDKLLKENDVDKNKIMNFLNDNDEIRCDEFIDKRGIAKRVERNKVDLVNEGATALIKLLDNLEEHGKIKNIEGIKGVINATAEEILEEIEEPKEESELEVGVEEEESFKELTEFSTNVEVPVVNGGDKESLIDNISKMINDCEVLNPENLKKLEETLYNEYKEGVAEILESPDLMDKIIDKCNDETNKGILKKFKAITLFESLINSFEQEEDYFKDYFKQQKQEDGSSTYLVFDDYTKVDEFFEVKEDSPCLKLYEKYVKMLEDPKNSCDEDSKSKYKGLLENLEQSLLDIGFNKSPIETKEKEPENRYDSCGRVLDGLNYILNNQDNIISTKELDETQKKVSNLFSEIDDERDWDQKYVLIEEKLTDEVFEELKKALETAQGLVKEKQEINEQLVRLSKILENPQAKNSEELDNIHTSLIAELEQKVTNKVKELNNEATRLEAEAERLKKEADIENIDRELIEAKKDKATLLKDEANAMNESMENLKKQIDKKIPEQKEVLKSENTVQEQVDNGVNSESTIEETELSTDVVVPVVDSSSNDKEKSKIESSQTPLQQEGNKAFNVLGDSPLQTLAVAQSSESSSPEKSQDRKDISSFEQIHSELPEHSSSVSQSSPSNSNSAASSVGNPNLPSNTNSSEPLQSQNVTTESIMKVSQDKITVTPVAGSEIDMLPRGVGIVLSTAIIEEPNKTPISTREQPKTMVKISSAPSTIGSQDKNSRANKSSSSPATTTNPFTADNKPQQSLPLSVEKEEQLEQQTDISNSSHYSTDQNSNESVSNSAGNSSKKDKVEDSKETSSLSSNLSEQQSSPDPITEESSDVKEKEKLKAIGSYIIEGANDASVNNVNKDFRNTAFNTIKELDDTGKYKAKMMIENEKGVITDILAKANKDLEEKITEKAKEKNILEQLQNRAKIKKENDYQLKAADVRLEGIRRILRGHKIEDKINEGKKGESSDLSKDEVLTGKYLMKVKEGLKLIKTSKCSVADNTLTMVVDGVELTGTLAPDLIILKGEDNSNISACQRKILERIQKNRFIDLFDNSKDIAIKEDNNQATLEGFECSGYNAALSDIKIKQANRFEMAENSKKVAKARLKQIDDATFEGEDIKKTLKTIFGVSKGGVALER